MVIDRVPITASTVQYRDAALPALRARSAYLATVRSGGDPRSSTMPSRRWAWGPGGTSGVAAAATSVGPAPPSLLAPSGFEVADGGVAGGGASAGAASGAPAAAPATLAFRGPPVPTYASHSGTYPGAKALAEVEYFPRMSSLYRDRRPASGDHRDRDHRVAVDEREEAAVRAVTEWLGGPLEGRYARDTLTDNVYGWLG